MANPPREDSFHQNVVIIILFINILYAWWTAIREKSSLRI